MDRIFEPVIEGFDDDRVADRHFQDVGDSEKSGKVSQVEVVAGVDPQADARRMRRGRRKPVPYFVFGIGTEGPGIRLGVKLDPICADRSSDVDLFGDGVHEKAHANAEVLELFDDWFRLPGIPGEIPSMVGGQLVRGIRHEGTLVGPSAGNDLQEVGSRVALDIEFDFWMRTGQPRQIFDVGIPGVTLIGSGVDCDSVNAGPDCPEGHSADVGVVGVTGIPDEGKLVEVDAQFRHGSYRTVSRMNRRFPTLKM